MFSCDVQQQFILSPMAKYLLDLDKINKTLTITISHTIYIIICITNVCKFDHLNFTLPSLTVSYSHPKKLGETFIA